MVERRTEPGVFPSVDADVCADVVAFGDLGPPVSKRRPIEGHAAPYDGGETASGAESQQRLLDVSRAERRVMALDAAAGRGKRWVHDDRVVDLLGREQIVQPFGVDGSRLESQAGEQLPTPWVDFVRIDVGARQPRQGRDVAGARARFQHAHPGAERRSAYDEKGFGGRRAELLEVDLPLVAPRLERQTSLLFEETCQDGGWTFILQSDLLQVHVKTRFDGVVDVAGASGGTAENLTREPGDR